MGLRWKLKLLGLRLSGRGQKADALERDRYRAALAQPWFDSKGDETLRLDYPLGPDSLVMDLGGYQGQFASDLFGRFACHILVFEPVGDYYRQLERRFGKNPSIEVFGFGLSDRDCEVILHVDGASTTAFSEAGAGVAAQLKAVGPFFSERGLQSVDLLKVNIEGGEYDLLDAMLDLGLIKTIRFLQIQFHDHVPRAEARLVSIRERLQVTHEIQWTFPWVWESWQRRADAP